PCITVPARVTGKTGAGEEKPIVVVVIVHPPGKNQLPMIVHALDALSFGFGFAYGRQQQTSQDANNGHHDKQFDQRECAFFSHYKISSSKWFGRTPRPRTSLSFPACQCAMCQILSSANVVEGIG